jgi:hypothetical protein
MALEIFELIGHRLFEGFADVDVEIAVHETVGACSAP